MLILQVATATAPLWLGPAIAAGGSLLSGILNHFSNKSLTNNSYRQNIQMWHEQNAYNSPISQVARLRQAGLNPALAYGATGQVVGNSEEAPQLDYGGVMNQPLIRPEIGLEAVQAANLESITKKNQAETVESLYRGVLSGARADYAKEYALQELRSMKLSNDKLMKDSELVDKTIDSVIANKNLTKEQISILMQQKEYNERTMEARIESTQLDPLVIRKSMREIDAKVNNLYASSAQFRANVGVLNETASKLKTENAILPSMLIADLAQGLSNIASQSKQRELWDSTIDKIAVETGIDKKELNTYMWRMFFGQGVDLLNWKNQNDRNFIGALAAGAHVLK